jgi:hypothetical protein
MHSQLQSGQPRHSKLLPVTIYTALLIISIPTPGSGVATSAAPGTALQYRTQHLAWQQHPPISSRSLQSHMHCTEILKAINDLLTLLNSISGHAPLSVTSAASIDYMMNGSTACPNCD